MNKLPKEFRFRPLTAFRWENEDVLIGEYYPGMSYVCSRFARHAALKGKCKEWLAEGKIEIIGLPAGKEFTIKTEKVT